MNEPNLPESAGTPLPETPLAEETAGGNAAGAANAPAVYRPAGWRGALCAVLDIVETLGMVTVCVMLCFAFLFRLNIVDGSSMEQTLQNGQYLLVSDIAYTPRTGDIVILHDISAAPYDRPLVKRVIAVGGQTVDIDFTTWTLTVDGVELAEPYRYLDTGYARLFAEYNMDGNGHFSVTVPAGEVFVMGDNRNNSGDSRQVELGTVDERCIVGRAYFRLFPLNRFGALSNPFAG